MFIRRTFDEFLKLQSLAEPALAARDWVIDWRWLTTTTEEQASESERSLIDCSSWARPKTPSRE